MATIHQFQPKTNQATLRCPSCGTTTDAPCSCGVGYEYVPPGKLAAQAIKDNPNLSDRAIAEKIGIDKDTVNRVRKSTGGNPPVAPRVGKDGKTRRMPRIATDTKQAMAQAFLDGGKTRPQIAAEFNVGENAVSIAVARELGRREGQADRPIDRDNLSVTAQQKLDAAIRQHQRKLDMEHAVRMRALDEEVRQRVLAEGKDYLASLNEMREKAWSEEKFYREMIDNHKPPFTKDQFKTILMCLHPDGQRTADKLSEAFRLFNNKKLQLTGEK
jgi:transposase-like protein